VTTLDILFRNAGTPPGDTQQLREFRVGQTYRYRLSNGCKRKFRVNRIFLGSQFGRKEPELLIEYLDTGTRQYVSAALTRKSLV